MSTGQLVEGYWLSDGERMHWVAEASNKTVDGIDVKALAEVTTLLPACEECQRYIFDLGTPLNPHPLWPKSGS
jgi:hypothetical protein